MKVIVLGAGVMGLAAAYRAAKDGHDVLVLEAAPEAGGMAGHFDMEGVSLERFYHFICRTDQPTFELLKQLGISDKLRWRCTTMGFFSGGTLHNWGNPLALLRYPGLSLVHKIRYGIFAFVCVRKNSWPGIENETAKVWITRWCGTSIYERFWKPLFDFKFYEYADDISAAWIWTRIRRIGRSRKSIFQEELGYLEGGSLTLVDALVKEIKAMGGCVQLGEAAKQVKVKDNRVMGVETGESYYPADAVICTVPTPYVLGLVPDLPGKWREWFASIRNIGVICVVFKLTQSVSPHFWINVSDPEVDIPGVIEFSNLRDVGGVSVVYVPYYMPTSNEKFSWPDEALRTEAFSCLQRINPMLQAGHILTTKVARLRYGQPICEPGFAARVPATQTSIEGLQIADTCYYYPEDRGIAESVRLGAAMAAALDSQQMTPVLTVDDLVSSDLVVDKLVPQELVVQTLTAQNLAV